MAQGDSHIETEGFKEADAPVEVSNKLMETSLEACIEPVETSVEAFAKPIETSAEGSCEPRENPTGTCTKPLEAPAEQSSEPSKDTAAASSDAVMILDGMSGEAIETAAKASNKSESSKRKTLKTLKAKSKIVKKPLLVNGPRTRSSRAAEVSESKTKNKQKTFLKPLETPAELSNEPIESPPRASIEPAAASTGESVEPATPTGESIEPSENTSRESIEPSETPIGASREPLDTPTGASTEPADTPTGASTEPADAPTGAFTEPAETAAKASSKLGPSEKKMPKSLKGKSKVVKKSLGVNKPNTRNSAADVSKNNTQKKQNTWLKPMETTPELSTEPTKIPTAASNEPTETPTTAFTEPTATPGRESNGPAESAAKANNKPEPSERKTPKFLKAKSKIVKKTLGVNDLKTSKTVGASANKKQNKHKSVSLVNLDGGKKGKGVEKVNSEQGNPSNSIFNKEQTDKSPQTQNNGIKTAESEKALEQKKENRNRNQLRKLINARKNKERDAETQRNSRPEMKEEKLGGLIFMCSAKTKPDCFRYRVMGISMGKKDIVLNIKPGLKIFLYDFDLKLLYGIYEASSSGGIKLEPEAFGGKFPAQVRFNVVKDCVPLPETVFKKAIKENYNEKNKFKTELTFKQVKKLRDLFRPAEVHSSALSIQSQPRASTRDRGTRKGVRDSLPHSKRENLIRDPYSNSEARAYPVRGRDKNVAQEVVPVQREDRDLYLTEREYRAYGLRGDRGNVTRPTHITASLETNPRDYEREHLVRHPHTIYRDVVPAQREVVHPDPLYLNDRDYHAYSLGVRRDFPSSIRHAPATSVTAIDSVEDPYCDYYYGGSSLNAYPPPRSTDEVPSGSYAVSGRREAYLMETDPLQRRETGRTDRLYSTYSAADALADRHRTYHGAQPEDLPASVPSRYPYSGSYRYR